MPTPKFEVASGRIDGVNRTFTVSSGYAPGTTAVFLNGQLKKASNDDGWAETNPSGGVVVLDQAPAIGDVVQVFFTAIVPHDETEGEVTRIFGKLRAVDIIEGHFREIDPFAGKLVAMESGRGSLRLSDNLLGAVVAVQQLQGVIYEREDKKHD